MDLHAMISLLVLNVGLVRSIHPIVLQYTFALHVRCLKICVEEKFATQ